MSEKTGNVMVQLPVSRLSQLHLLREYMEKKTGRTVKLNEIVASAIIQMLEGIFDDEGNLREEAVE